MPRLPGPEDVPSRSARGGGGIPRVPQNRTNEGLVELGGAVAEAGQRIQKRQATVNLIQGERAYSESLLQELRRIEDEEDLASDSVIRSFGQFSQEKMNEVLEGHSGTPDSRVQLLSSLSGIRQKASERLAAANISAGRELIIQDLGEKNSELVGLAGQDPTLTVELFDMAEQNVRGSRDALPKAKEDEILAVAKEQIGTASVESYLARGDHRSADAVLRDPDMAGVFSADTRRRLRSGVIRLQASEEAEARKVERLRVQYRQILGRDPTPDELARAAGFSSKEKTLSEKVTEFETVLGRPPNEDEITRMAGISATFGTGLRGQALNIITNDAIEFGAGTLSPERERRFLSSVTEYTQPVSIVNPDTGLLETRSPKLPSYVAESLRRRGMSVEDFTSGSIPTDQPQEVTQEPDPVLPSAQRLGGKTIYELSSLATGPISGTAEALARTPIVGEFMTSPQMVQVRQTIPLLQRDLVRVLQNNTKFAEGERVAIEEEIDIKPKFFDTPTRFRNSIIGIDDALAVREQNAINTLAQGDKIGREERIHTMNVLNAIIKFRQVLMPPRVFTDEQREKLPSGTLYVDPDGNMREKR